MRVLTLPTPGIWSQHMDVVFIGLAAFFFLLASSYVWICDVL
ncbi:hypothetical protein [Chelatococcus asaccharovorans]|nr:hypothetical protein [Chelatococcus asaccharovorans]CAH1649433.1 hypothetical protein CHELA17_20139 [Chelatococcus asaccharovorans]CAH1691567.1 hypothetical protein CHELA40_50175 [Chelatococcus asaccharovorans]